MRVVKPLSIQAVFFWSLLIPALVILSCSWGTGSMARAQDRDQDKEQVQEKAQAQEKEQAQPPGAATRGVLHGRTSGIG